MDTGGKNRWVNNACKTFQYQNSLITIFRKLIFRSSSDNVLAVQVLMIQTCFRELPPFSHRSSQYNSLPDSTIPLSPPWHVGDGLYVSGGPIMGPVAALLLLLLITMCGYYPSRLQQAGKYKLYDLTPCKPDNNRVFQVHFEHRM